MRESLKSNLMIAFYVCGILISLGTVGVWAISAEVGSQLEEDARGLENMRTNINKNKQEIQSVQKDIAKIKDSVESLDKKVSDEFGSFKEDMSWVRGYLERERAALTMSADNYERKSLQEGSRLHTIHNFQLPYTSSEMEIFIPQETISSPLDQKPKSPERVFDVGPTE